MTTTPEVATVPASNQFSASSPAAGGPEQEASELYREINARRAQLENADALRTIRSL